MAEYNLALEAINSIHDVAQGGMITPYFLGVNWGDCICNHQTLLHKLWDPGQKA